MAKYRFSSLKLGKYSFIEECQKVFFIFSLVIQIFSVKILIFFVIYTDFELDQSGRYEYTFISLFSLSSGLLVFLIDYVFINLYLENCLKMVNFLHNAPPRKFSGFFVKNLLAFLVLVWAWTHMISSCHFALHNLPYLICVVLCVPVCSG